MSFEKMIALHPHSDHRFDPLALAARHAGLCALMCTSCADACLAEEGDMRQPIRMTLDCADICGTTGRLIARAGGADPAVTQAQLQACIAACRACEAECQGHASMHEHCKHCAEACRTCAQACEQAMQGLQQAA